MKVGNITNTMIADFNNGSKEVLIYPYPAYEILNFGNITNEVTVNISDISGKIILQKDISKINASIDISSLHKGVYLISIIDKQGKITSEKFINQ